MIAIDIPHPGATYFGANNYEAGLLAGRHLARWAKQHWSGQADEILLLELARAGSLPAARGARRAWPAFARCCTTRRPGRWSPIDADGQFKTALERVRRHLRVTKARRILVGAANDPSALGAARAFQEAGRADTCAIVGQNAEPDARAELRAAAHAAHRLGRLFPRALRGRPRSPRPRHPGPAPGRPGDVRQAPDRHARKRRSPVSQRRAAGRGDLRTVLTSRSP